MATHPTRTSEPRPGPRRLTRRLTQLWLGLVLYGFSLALLVEAGLGLAPWDVLHEGLGNVTGLSIGLWVNLTGAAVLLLWLPLRQRPGIGTVSNVVVIGLALDASLRVLPNVDSLTLRIVLVLLGVGLNAIATAAYIGARLGPGPRDGLMTGLAARGLTIRTARVSIEVTVLIAGFALGGTVGVGTVVYAFGIGPLVHPLLPRFEVGLARPVAGPIVVTSQPTPDGR